MNSISWDNVESLLDSEITYLLYSEGKSIESICRIRNMQRADVERHIIECKIKYRIFEGSNSIQDVIRKLTRCGRDERKSIIGSLSGDDKLKLEKHAINNLFNSTKQDCSFYIWLLGELKSHDAVQQIVAFLKCSDGNIKRMCCSALGKIGDEGAENALISCMKDSKPQVREYAIKSLGKLKSKKALPFIYKIIQEQNEKEYIIRSAAWAVKAIEGKGEGVD